MTKVRCRQAYQDWTRWFNFHSKRHILATYPDGYRWYGLSKSNPIYLQETQPDISNSVRFPKEAIQDHFRTSYFTCSVAWMIAFAIFDRATHIELYGIGPDHDYKWQRPCLAYWLQIAETHGVSMLLPDGLDFGPIGDPSITGPLYGYETT